MTESKFEKFSEFICEGLLYPLVAAFIATLIPLGGFLIFEAEWMWSVWLAFILYAILGVWLVLLIICVIINKVIDYREDKAYEAQQARCKTCDCYRNEDFADDCYDCENGSKYKHILIEKDESEE